MGKLPDETLVIDKATKGIQWTVVRIMDVKAPEPAQPFVGGTLDQVNCRFIPHALVTPVGVDLTVKNSDDAPHNFHAFPKDETLDEMNRMMSPKSEIIVKKNKLGDPDVFLVKCDVHGWMSALIVVHDPRFAVVTPADGAFEIKNVPPGSYTVKIQQETLGEKVLQVTVKVGETTDVGEVKFSKR